MDTKIAAANLRQYLSCCESTTLPGGDAVSVGHVDAMITSIETGAVCGEKAHRWLGWAQAVICCRGGATLEEMKKVNFEA